jgi:hypothetical protein
MQTTVLPNDFGARPQHQVKRVAENDVGPALRHLFRRHALDRPVGTNGHERRRLHHATAEVQLATPCGPVRFSRFEFHE